MFPAVRFGQVDGTPPNKQRTGFRGEQDDLPARPHETTVTAGPAYVEPVRLVELVELGPEAVAVRDLHPDAPGREGGGCCSTAARLSSWRGTVRQQDVLEQ